MSVCGRIKGATEEAMQLRALLKRVGIKVPKNSKKIYEKAIEKLHSDERNFVRRGKRRTFTNLVERCSSFRYPAIFNDYDREDKSDDSTLRDIHKSNRRMLKGVRRQKHLRGLVEDMVRKTNDNRVLYSSSEATALETARGAPADCTELTRYAFARLKLAGFKPKLVFVENDEKETLLIGKTKTPFHILIAVKDPANAHKYFYIDLYNGGFVKEPKHKQFVSPRTLMSIYHHNKGIYYEEMREKFAEYIDLSSKNPRSSMLERAALALAKIFKEGSEALALKHHDRAIHYDPTYAPAFYSKAYFLWSIGKRLSEVRTLTARALKLMPAYKDAIRLQASIPAD